VATANVLKSPTSPSKIGSDPQLFEPSNFPVAVSKQYTPESLLLSVQKNSFPSLEKRIVETARVFLPKLVLDTIYIVSEFQTMINGFAPSDPQATYFL
jgi:hypothetical protein